MYNSIQQCRDILVITLSTYAVIYHVNPWAGIAWGLSMSVWYGIDHGLYRYP